MCVCVCVCVCVQLHSSLQDLFILLWTPIARYSGSLGLRTHAWLLQLDLQDAGRESQETKERHGCRIPVGEWGDASHSLASVHKPHETETLQLHTRDPLLFAASNTHMKNIAMLQSHLQRDYIQSDLQRWTQGWSPPASFRKPSETPQKTFRRPFRKPSENPQKTFRKPSDNPQKSTVYCVNMKDFSV